jgi:hypothetical protein
VSLIGDITKAYHAPASVMQAQIDRGITDAQTLFYAMFFGVMNLLASYPRIAALTPDPDMLAAKMGGLFISYVFFLPLMMFGAAGVLNWVILKFTNGHTSWSHARRAFVWSAVVTIPFVLIYGLAFIIGNNTLQILLNVITAIVFVFQLCKNFKVAAFL